MKMVKTSFKFYFVTLFFYCFFISLKGQNSNFKLKSLGQIASIIDTVDVKKCYATIKIKWLSDTFEITRLVAPIQYNLEGMRKAFKDPNFTPTEEEKQQDIEFRTIGAQNCYSYALEKVFNYHGINPQIVFNAKTEFGLKAMHTIINSSFIKITEFEVKNKNFKLPVENGTLIVFRDKNNWIRHAFFYNDGIFYSKNGGSKAKEYKKMKDIYKVYWDTKLFQLYQLDFEKLAREM